MVDFYFDLKKLFPTRIIRVQTNLYPHNFKDDPNVHTDIPKQMARIINQMGYLSAHSQGLNSPITTSQKICSDKQQVLYLIANIGDNSTNAGNSETLMLNQMGNEPDLVQGLLKVGKKNLYLYNEKGVQFQVSQAPCVLDFYIHESCSRKGLGRILYDYMLTDQNWSACKTTVDRPSPKMVQFLAKHYNLKKIIPQANHFLIFEGFFTDSAARAVDDEDAKAIAEGIATPRRTENLQISPVGRYDSRRSNSDKMRDILNQSN